MFTAAEIRSLNELELSVYNYILLQGQSAAYLNIRELASAAHVSTTTILHFCKKMHCDGFAEFKQKLRDYLEQQTPSALYSDMAEIRRFLDTMQTDEYQSKLYQAVEMLCQADRVLIAGIGSSCRVAQYAARYFSGVGLFTFCMDDPFFPLRMNHSVQTLAVLLSVSGETGEIIDIANRLKAESCPLISITNTGACTLARMSNLNLTYYVTPIREGQLDLTTQVPPLYIMETLAKRYRTRMEEQEEGSGIPQNQPN